MTFYPPPSQEPIDPQNGQPQPPPVYSAMPPPQPGYAQHPYGQPGAMPPPPPYNPYAAPQGSNGMAIAGLVCGIVGLLILGFVLGPLAIIFGSIGRSRAKKGASGGGMALAGLILGIVDIVAYAVILAVVVDHGGFFV